MHVALRSDYICCRYSVDITTRAVRSKRHGTKQMLYEHAASAKWLNPALSQLSERRGRVSVHNVHFGLSAAWARPSVIGKA